MYSAHRSLSMQLTRKAISQTTKDKIWTLSFWSGIFPYLATGGYVIGLITISVSTFLNYGYIDLSVPNLICIPVTLISALCVALSLVLFHFLNYFDKLPQKNQKRISVFIFIMNILIPISGNLNTNIHSFLEKRSMLLPKTFQPTLDFLFALSILLCVMVISLVLLNGCLKTPRTKKWKQISIWTIKAIIYAIVVLLPLTFSGLIYLSTTSLYGGSYPEPILLWVPQNSVPIFTGKAASQTDFFCPSPDYAVLQGFSLVHEGSDYLFLWSQETKSGIFISKDLVKRRQWVVRTDPQTLDALKDPRFSCSASKTKK